jgi:hypothetical protein
MGDQECGILGKFFRIIEVFGEFVKNKGNPLLFSVLEKE